MKDYILLLLVFLGMVLIGFMIGYSYGISSCKSTCTLEELNCTFNELNYTILKLKYYLDGLEAGYLLCKETYHYEENNVSENLSKQIIEACQTLLNNTYGGSYPRK